MQIESIKINILIVFEQKCLDVSVNVMNNDTVHVLFSLKLINSFFNILFHKVDKYKIQ